MLFASVYMFSILLRILNVYGEWDLEEHIEHLKLRLRQDDRAHDAGICYIKYSKKEAIL